MRHVAARLDVAGIILMALLGLWTLVSGAATGTAPFPLLGMILLGAATLVVARAATVRARPMAAAAVVILAASLLLVAVGGVANVAGPPLGYENANAGLFLQGSVGGVMVAVAWSSRPIRITGAVAAVVFAVAAGITGSRAGLLMLPLPLVALIVPPGRWTRVWGAVAALGFVGALVVTLVLAGAPPDGRIPARTEGVAATGLGRDRVRLWGQALDLMGEHPVFGVGPGRFRVSSPTARSDADLRWAHNEFLQLGAETGVPGFLLMGLLFMWGFARILVSPSDRLSGLGAASLAAVGIQATVDYVLHFPAIVVAAAALLGTAQARRDRSPDEARVGTVARSGLKAMAIPLGAFRRRRPGDVTILLYHRVGVGGREIDLPDPAFRRQLAALDLARVVPMDDVLREGSGGVVLTVDDGFRDFHEHVVPALVDYGMPTVLYLATGLIVEEGGDARDGLTWDHLREAVATGLVTVGSHTHSHADLGRATEAEAETEMRRSKELIEDRLGVACRHFAYPWGVGSAEADRVARRLFASAALRWGTNRADRLDPYRLARVPVLRSDGPMLFRAKVAGMLDGEAVVYRLAGRGPWRRR